MWVLRARSRGVEEPEVNASLTLFPPGAPTVLQTHRPQQKLGLFSSVRDVICAFPSVHLTM